MKNIPSLTLPNPNPTILLIIPYSFSSKVYCVLFAVYVPCIVHEMDYIIIIIIITK